MKLWTKICGLFLAVCYLPLAFASATPAGNWTSIDDKTGKKRAVINLSISGDTLNGSIVKVFPQPGDTGICTNCTGKFKDKKVAGLNIVWGLKDKGNGEWDGGYILDPKSGKIYRAKMTLKGNTLYVRGYIGVSLLGRTQTWVR